MKIVFVSHHSHLCSVRECFMPFLKGKKIDGYSYCSSHARQLERGNIVRRVY